MKRMGSWKRRSGTREQIAAAGRDESGGWSLACEIQREDSLWFVEAAALPVQIYKEIHNPLVSHWLLGVLFFLF